MAKVNQSTGEDDTVDSVNNVGVPHRDRWSTLKHLVELVPQAVLVHI
jgi:hypothetical protein